METKITFEELNTLRALLLKLRNSWVSLPEFPERDVIAKDAVSRVHSAATITALELYPMEEYPYEE